jgi:Uma2 family endonuclease
MATEHIPDVAINPTTGIARVFGQPQPSTELCNGDQMSREEFHQLYSQMPEDFKAELIGGIVYVASPVSRSHGKPQLFLGNVLGTYELATPGVDASDNTTLLLGKKSEPQPDLYLRILPECGGQSKTTEDEYIDGAPEFVLEIAHTSRAIDLHGKKKDYARHGVLEYLVHCVKEKQMQWIDLSSGAELQPDADGIYRVRTFPGLWIDGRALFAKDYAKLMTTLHEGLASPEHAAFVRDLDARRAKK